MSSRQNKQKKKYRLPKIVAISLTVFALGAFMLFHVSRMLKPFLGNTFHILVGCMLMAVALLVLFVNLKNHYFPKKRRTHRRALFLEDELKKQNKSSDSK